MNLLVHVMPWFGNGNIHRMDSYLSNDPAAITNQINIMRSARILGLPVSGVIMTWQGPASTFQHAACQEWCTQCQTYNFLFGLLLDPWIAKINSPTGNPDLQTVINALNDPTSQAMLNAPCYLPEKFILNFNIGVSSASLAPSFPGFTFLDQDIGFAWPTINTSIASPSARLAASVQNLLNQHNNPAMRIPAVMFEFRDGGFPTPSGVSLGNWTGTRDYNTSVWGPQDGNHPARVIDRDGGKAINDYYATSLMQSSAVGAPYLAVVTWNDYDEGTDVEAFWSAATGIRIGS